MYELKNYIIEWTDKEAHQTAKILINYVKINKLYLQLRYLKLKTIHKLKKYNISPSLVTDVKVSIQDDNLFVLKIDTN